MAGLFLTRVIHCSATASERPHTRASSVRSIPQRRVCAKMSPVIRSQFFFPAFLFLGLASLSGIAHASSSKSKADEQAGAVLFRDKGCAYCHGADLKGTKKAPSLDNIRSDKAWSPEKMTDQILNGGEKMPPFRESVSDEEIAQLVAYLRAKNRPVPPPADTTPAPQQ